MKRTSILTFAFLTFFAASSALAQSTTTKPAGTTATNASATTAEPSMIILVHKPSYPFTTCIATGQQLPPKPVDYVKNGRLFRLADEASKAAVDANLAAFTKKIEDAVIAQQKPTYPLQTSAVSDKPLGVTPTTHVFGTRLILLADPTEVPTFEANPAAAVQKLDKAYIDAQFPTYPYKIDPVTKEKLADLATSGKQPVKFLWGNKLILFTDAKNASEFQRTPEVYMAVLAAGR
jgi:hypothetical protein